VLLQNIVVVFGAVTAVPTSSVCTTNIADWFGPTASTYCQTLQTDLVATLTTGGGVLAGIAQQLVDECGCNPNTDETADQICHGLLSTTNAPTNLNLEDFLVAAGSLGGDNVALALLTGEVSSFDFCVGALEAGGMTEYESGRDVVAFCGGTTCPVPYTCSSFGSPSCTPTIIEAIFANLTSQKKYFCGVGQTAAVSIAQCAGANCNVNVTSLCSIPPSIAAAPTSPTTCGKSTHYCTGCSGTTGSDAQNEADAGGSSNPSCAFFSGLELIKQVCVVNQSYPAVPVTCSSLLQYVSTGSPTGKPSTSDGSVVAATITGLTLIGALFAL